jgi:hypothetical protein
MKNTIRSRPGLPPTTPLSDPSVLSLRQPWHLQHSKRDSSVSLESKITRNDFKNDSSLEENSMAHSGTSALSGLTFQVSVKSVYLSVSLVFYM